MMVEIESILVVCVGNICRSPTGERLLQCALPNKKITSAGLRACVGKPAEETATQVAKAQGLSLAGHRAQQLNAELCRLHDLILVMEKRHIAAVCQIAPAVHGKTKLFGYWRNQAEVADPYQQGREAFESAYCLLSDYAQEWAKKLS